MICQLRKTYFFWNIYKNEYTCFNHCKSMKENDVEVIEYGSEMWINQKHREKNLIFPILLIELSIIL